jgi:hypothetical protein
VRQLRRLEPRFDDLGMGQNRRDRVGDIGGHDRCRCGSPLGHCQVARPAQLAVLIRAGSKCGCTSAPQLLDIRLALRQPRRFVQRRSIAGRAWRTGSATGASVRAFPRLAGMLFAYSAAALASQADVFELVALGPGEGSRSFPCLALIHLPGDRGAAAIVIPVKYWLGRPSANQTSKLPESGMLRSACGMMRTRSVIPSMLHSDRLA